MEPLRLTRIHTPSRSPKSSKKRASSPDAPTSSTKKPKTDPGQADKGRKRKRKKKQKKQHIAHDSGAVPGIAQNVPSSPLAPGSPLPSASKSTETRLSDSPFDSSSTLSPPIRSSPVAMAPSSHDQRVACTPLRKERVMPTLHSECKSLREHKTLLASLVSSLVCPICLDLLHKPFALSPCGHVSCYRCLINWFNVDQQPDGLEAGSVFRKKTCPHCRAVVHGRPMEAWNIKDMVTTVVRSRLAQEFYQEADVDFEVAASTSSETPPQDPWANIFPPTLLRPGIPPLEASPDIFGMYDAEDQVYRCLDCMHEIWGGSCSQCGRHYNGHDVDASDDNASGEEHHGRWSILERISGWPRSVSGDESDNGSYENSFIDDEDSERSDRDEVTAPATRQGMRGAGEVQVTFSEGSEDGDGISVSDESQKPLHSALGTRRQVLRDSDAGDNCGDSTKSEDDESLPRPPMRLFGRRRCAMPEGERVESEISVSDDSDNVGSGGGHTSDGAYTAGITMEENSDEDDERW